MKRKIAVMVLLVLMISALTAAYAATYVRATASVHVRTGPGLTYASLGTISKGTTLTYLNSTSYDERGVAWYLVSWKGSNGWVSSVYSELTSKKGSSFYGTTYVRALGRVNVRKGPGTQYASINSLLKGEQVEYLEESRYDKKGNLWYKVQYYSYGVGWVSADYVELVTTGSEGAPSIGASVYGSYVEAVSGDTKIRSGPAISYASLGTMYVGDVATYLNNYSVDERGIIWYYVNFNGLTGWISSRYVELY